MHLCHFILYFITEVTFYIITITLNAYCLSATVIISSPDDVPSPFDKKNYEEKCQNYITQVPFVCDLTGLGQVGITTAHELDLIGRKQAINFCPYCPEDGPEWCRSEGIHVRENKRGGWNHGIVVIRRATLISQTRKKTFQTYYNRASSRVYFDTQISGAVYAESIRRKWSDPSHNCSMDILFLIVYEWTIGSGSRRTIIDNTCYRYIALSQRFQTYYNTTASAIERHIKGTRQCLNDGLHVVLVQYMNKQLSKILQELANHRYLVHMRVGSRAPPWALLVLFGCPPAAFIFAIVGHYVTKRNRKCGSLTGGKFKTGGNAWKAGFSGGVWAK